MTYESELRETVLTLDVERMRQLDQRWFGITSTMDDAATLATMHKIRLHLNGVPEAECALSREWLAERGHTPESSRDAVQGIARARASMLAPIGLSCS
jgi:hypothetical protein